MKNHEIPCRRLGQTTMEITRIGFGAWAVGGGGWRYGWGKQGRDESLATIRRALELGINWIDTAPVYGVGLSEELVGEAIAALPEAERPYVVTKCGLLGSREAEGSVLNTLQPSSIRAEIDASLKRLRLEQVDLYLIHWPDPDHEIEEAWQTLTEIRQSGKVAHIGVSNFDVTQLERLAAIAPVEVVEPPYSLLRSGADQEILPYCADHGIGVITYSPMYSGLLSGAMTKARVEGMTSDDWRREDPEFQEPQLSRNLDLVELLRTIGARTGHTAGEVAIAWTLANPHVTAAIVGARRPHEPDGTVGAATLALTGEDLEEIAELMGS